MLQNGNVLVTGGYNGNGDWLKSAEVYNGVNPSTGKWTLTGSPKKGRYSHTATLLPNGNVLVAGGNSYHSLNSAEIYGCPPGSFGPFCSLCQYNCTNGGSCFDGFIGNGTCLCLPGYVGSECEIPRCDLVGCNANGECQPSGVCSCVIGWTGQFCNIPNLCPPKPCQQGEYLEDHTCACAFGYDGDFCENLSILYAMIPSFIVIIGMVVSFRCTCLAGGVPRMHKTALFLWLCLGFWTW